MIGKLKDMMRGMVQAEGIVDNETEGNKGCRVNGDRLSSTNDDVVTSDEQTSFRSDA